MKTRYTLYVITLIAYTLSLAHSVIPHHHHKTADEAAVHEHADHHDHSAGHHHNHKQKQEDKKPAETGHFFFFTHDVNADVLIKHSATDKPVKVKKVHIAVPVSQQIISFEGSAHLVFHPLQDDPHIRSTVFSFHALRGPPSLVI
jgi:hypothetical protein